MVQNEYTSLYRFSLGAMILTVMLESTYLFGGQVTAKPYVFANTVIDPAFNEPSLLVISLLGLSVVAFLLTMLITTYQQGQKLRIVVYQRTKELRDSNTNLRAVNEELQRSLDAFQSLYYHNPYAVYLFDLEGNFVSANKVTTDITGYSIDQLLNMSFVPLIPKKNLDKVLMNFVKARSGSTQNYQTELISASGKYLCVDVTNIPVIVGGKTTGVYGIIKDITEEKLLSDELLLSNERFQLANKATSDSIWDWDLENNKVERIGKCIETQFGYDTQDPDDVDAFWSRAAHPEDWQRVNSKREAIFKNPKQDYWEDEYRFLAASGEYGFIYDRGYIIRNDQGRAIRVIGAAKNITHRKLNDERLKLMEMVITHTSDAVLISKATDEGIKIIYSNDAFTKMTGYTLKDIAGKIYPILRGDDSDSEELQLFRKAQADWQPYRTEIINYKKSGEPFWIEVNMVPVANKTGKFTHYISIERDITERKNHIKAIEDQNSKLREISWIQSHVVRAPLTRIIGLIDLIQDNNVSESMLSELLTYIKTSGLEMDTIIRDIVKKSELVNSDLLLNEKVVHD